MLPYFALLVFVFFTYAISDTLNLRQACGSRYFKFFTTSALVLFAGLRNINVGTDTVTYVWFWNRSLDYPSELTLFSEPLFDVYSLLTKQISNYFGLDYSFYLTGISLLVCLLYVNTIERHSNYRFQSLVIFILLGFYTFYFNGARQAISVAIFFYSYRFILSGERIKYFSLLFIAFLIHKSVILMLPFYWIFRLGLSRRTVFMVLICTICVAFSVNYIVEFASSYDSRYSGYSSSEFEGGGLVSVMFYTSILIFLLTCKYVNKIELQLYDHCLLAMLLSVCIGWISVVLSLDPSGILRLMLYFTQFLIFSIPIAICSFKKGFSRTIVSIGLYIFLTIYFYMTTSTFSGLVPYKFSLDFCL